jgi:hypothetical protein
MIDKDDFWEKYRKDDDRRLHLCDIPEEVFYARHKNVMKLVTEQGYPADEIGLLIAGTYYSNVWGSRSCSGYLAKLMKVPGGSYMTYYLSSSSYFFSKNSENEVYVAFLKADALDNPV